MYLQKSNSMVVNASSKITSSRAGLMTLGSLVRKPNRLTIMLADVSSSMGGPKLESLKTCLTKVWRPGFVCIGFSSKLYDIQQSDIPEIYATGSTYFLPALHAAWGQEPSHVILLTDGDAMDSHLAIIDEVKLHPTIPIDTIGISASSYNLEYNPQLLQQISSITGGKFNSVSTDISNLMLTECVENLLLLADGSTPAQAQKGVITL